MPIVEVFLGAFLQVLFDRIASKPVLDFFQHDGLDKSRLSYLETVLLMLEPVLDNAKEKQFTNGRVKKWLHRLKAAVFNAEDLLDQIAAKNLPSSMEPKLESQSWSAAVCNFVSSPFNSFEKEAAFRLDEIIQMLENMANQIPIFGLTVGAPLSKASQTRLTTSLVKESQVYERKEKKDHIIQLLLSQDNEQGGAMGRVAIVGMGGMGKTSLARLVNKDDRLEGCFGLKLWIYVSKDFDVVRMMLGVRELKIRSSYSVRSTLGHKLHKLSNEDGWSFFSRYAFQSGSSAGADPQLVKIGQEIIEKCDGLPLAIKILTSLLHSKSERRHWEKFLDSSIWDLPSGNNDILPALSLSYCFLPSCLKRGRLLIKGLENIANVDHAREADLKEMGDLDDLEFKFCPSRNNNSEKERDVLENLRPHANLEKLTIVYYGAPNFPSWLGDDSFQWMTFLNLENCAFFDFLPSLGQLPSLKVLRIEGMNKLNNMPPSGLAELPSLKNLTISNCLTFISFEDLRLPEGLNYLRISKCPALKSLPKGMFQHTHISLIDIWDCGSLEFSCSHNDGLPSSIQSLSVTIVKKMEFPKLISLHRMQLYSSLSHLKIANHVGLLSFPLGVLPKLQTLSFWRCENLEDIHIPQGRGIATQNGLRSLSELYISECLKLEHVAKEGLPIPNLKKLSFVGCENLKSLPLEMCANLTSL
ncbi:hypothetical protein Ancab_022104 [Ancistrocladus abbreviatus]